MQLTSQHDNSSSQIKAKNISINSNKKQKKKLTSDKEFRTTKNMQPINKCRRK